MQDVVPNSFELLKMNSSKDFATPEVRRLGQGFCMYFSS